MIRLSIPGAAVLLCAAMVSNAAQAPPPKVVNTRTGVYTAAQASKGEQVYMAFCLSCHPAGTYTTPAFREKWNGQLLSELFSFMSTQMPKEQPGTLEDKDYINVIAYLLKINGAPAGKKELPADEKALRWIRISMAN
jgi:hypothetical protein